VSISWETQFDI